ncbi:MAG: hypothetical protein HQL41_00890 [Alphaproteobacteria bacterium]|nr:hypothetical protein [Alphaproteobacteria bacterium]
MTTDSITDLDMQYLVFLGWFAVETLVRLAAGDGFADAAAQSWAHALFAGLAVLVVSLAMRDFSGPAPCPREPTAPPPSNR